MGDCGTHRLSFRPAPRLGGQFDHVHLRRERAEPAELPQPAALPRIAPLRLHPPGLSAAASGDARPAAVVPPALQRSAAFYRLRRIDHADLGAQRPVPAFKHATDDDRAERAHAAAARRDAQAALSPGGQTGGCRRDQQSGGRSPRRSFTRVGARDCARGAARLGGLSCQTGVRIAHGPGDDQSPERERFGHVAPQWRLFPA